MKRRTNLFYTKNNIDESNFLTFSNYTEHLTGVVLATEFKLYPSQFVCFYIPSLEQITNEELFNKHGYVKMTITSMINGVATINDKSYELIEENTAVIVNNSKYFVSDDKTCLVDKSGYPIFVDDNENICSSLRELFVKQYLVGYYENKLAFLRDSCISDNENTVYPDRELRYFAYLIEAIKMFDENAELVYYSDITEQDYNGTFTDIICTIDSSSSIKVGYKLRKTKTYNQQVVKVDDEYINQLYGWSPKTLVNGEYVNQWNGPEYFKHVKPIFDSEWNEYYKDTHYQLDINNISLVSNHGEYTELAFNVVIPLYDIVHFNPSTNTIILPDEDSEYIKKPLDYVPSVLDEHAVNVPYGIWFSSETILLKRADFKQYAPSWSLMIGTQFKPFPNSEYLTVDSNDQSKMAGFVTFSQVLSKHNEIVDSLISYQKRINDLEEEVRQKIDVVKDYQTTIDTLLAKVETLENTMNSIIKENNMIINGNKQKWQIK